MLNALQIQKFEEQSKLRENGLKIEQIPTEIKQEECKRVQTNAFYLRDEEDQKLENDNRLDDLDEWFLTPENMDLKYEESNHSDKENLKIELYHDDSELYFGKQQRMITKKVL